MTNLTHLIIQSSSLSCGSLAAVAVLADGRYVLASALIVMAAMNLAAVAVLRRAIMRGEP